MNMSLISLTGAPAAVLGKLIKYRMHSSYPQNVKFIVCSAIRHFSLSATAMLYVSKCIGRWNLLAISILFWGTWTIIGSPRSKPSFASDLL